jgi:hypothetical protein
MIIREVSLSFKALLLASCAGFHEGIVPHTEALSADHLTITPSRKLWLKLLMAQRLPLTMWDIDEPMNSGHGRRMQLDCRPLDIAVQHTMSWVS